MRNRTQRILPALLVVAALVLASTPVLGQSQAAGPVFASKQNESLQGGNVTIVQLSANFTQLGGSNETYYVVLGPNQYQGVWHESNQCKGFQQQDETSNQQEWGSCSQAQKRAGYGDTECLSLATNHQWFEPDQSCVPSFTSAPPALP